MRHAPFGPPHVNPPTGSGVNAAEGQAHAILVEHLELRLGERRPRDVEAELLPKRKTESMRPPKAELDKRVSTTPQSEIASLLPQNWAPQP